MTGEAGKGDTYRRVDGDKYRENYDCIFGGKMNEPKSTNPKDRIGIKKPPLHLIPSSALLHEAMAMKNGMEKYGPFNWRSETVAGTIYIAAAMRHILAWMDGNNYAEDSGVHHLGHARASLGIILDAMETGNLVDDRPEKGPAVSLTIKLTTKGEMKNG